MIVQLRGKILALYPTSIVLEVAQIGYELGISANTASSLGKGVGEECTLFTRMIVKENALELYGFATAQERLMFDKIITISGAGPKLALAILSMYTPARLVTIAQTQDIHALSQVSGVGKKKAQRLLVELSDMCARDLELAHLASDVKDTTQNSFAPALSATAYQEAEAALLSMGFTPKEIELALPRDDAQLTDGVRCEDLIAQGLKRLGGDR